MGQMKIKKDRDLFRMSVRLEAKRPKQQLKKAKGR